MHRLRENGGKSDPEEQAAMEAYFDRLGKEFAIIDALRGPYVETRDIKREINEFVPYLRRKIREDASYPEKTKKYIVQKLCKAKIKELDVAERQEDRQHLQQKRKDYFENVVEKELKELNNIPTFRDRLLTEENLKAYFKEVETFVSNFKTKLGELGINYDDEKDRKKEIEKEEREKRKKDLEKELEKRRRGKPLPCTVL